MLTAPQVLDHYYLESRCALLELAATFDRHDRAAGSNGHATGDQRLAQLYAAIDLLADRRATPDRAERLLRLFSDPND